MAGERLSILVVDDEEIVGKRLRQVLEKAGYEVEVFTSGREAVERLSEREFDIVVSDIRMDDVDGMDVLDAVRRT
ncbi:MAG: response regulator, partial [Deltaproteobacteria bacterium]